MSDPFDLLNKALGITKSGKQVVTPDFNVANSTPQISANIDRPFAASPLGIATNTVLGIPKTAYSGAKFIADTLTNIPGNLAREATNFASGDVPNALVPSNKRQFGTISAPPLFKVLPGYGNENVNPLASQISSLELNLKEKGFGKYSLPLAFGGVVGSTALDFTPFGGEKKLAGPVVKNIPFKFLKFLAETSDKKVLAETFVKIGIKDPAVVSNLVDKISPVNTTKEAKDVFINNLVAKPVEKKSLSILAKSSGNQGREVISSIGKTAQDITQKGKNVLSQAENSTANKQITAPINTTSSRVIDSSLAQEAKRYKSAEEFAKVINDRILLHGGPKNLKDGKLNIGMGINGGDAGGVFFTPNTPVGEMYARSYTLKGSIKTGEGLIHKVVLSPNAKIFDATNSMHLKRLESIVGKDGINDIISTSRNGVMDWATGAQYFDQLQEAGFSGARLSERPKGFDLFNKEGKLVKAPDHATSIVVFDNSNFDMLPNNITESKLTDIWNKAHGKKQSIIDKIRNIPNKQGGFAKVPEFNKKGVVPGNPQETLKNVEKIVGVKPRKIVNRAEYDAGHFAKKPEQLPPALEQKAISIEIQKEAIQNNPLNNLVKYASKSGENKGHLPEVLGGKGTSGFKKKGDDIITEALGQNIDSETARAKFDKFVEHKNAVKQAEIELKNEIKATKLSSEGIPMALSKRQREIMKAGQAERTKGVSPIQSVVQSEKVGAHGGSTGEVQSLEKLAEQSATREIHDPQLRKSVALPRIIEKLPTPVKAKVNMLDYMRTPENVLKKIGLQKNANEIRRAYDAYLNELPKNIDKITAWADSLPKESSRNIFRYLDGQPIDLTPKELEVAGEIKSWLSQWADRLGLPADNRIADYITHIFDDQLIKKEFDEDLAKIIAEKVPGSVYNPFLQQRLGAKGYKEDVWAALDAYVKRGTRKVHMDPALSSLQDVAGHLEESQWNYVKRYADRINLRPTEFDNLIDNGIKSVFGYRAGQRPVATISRTLRQATYRGMLGLNAGSALRNLSQGINTYAKLGEKYTALGYLKLFSPENMKELNASGILNSAFVQDRVLSSSKKLLQKTDKVLFYMFETAEKINRGSAYFGAKAKGIANGMTENQAIEYAKKIVRDTQFQFGSIDTPVAMSSDIMKVLGQFQTFTTKQIEFLAGMAKNKEYAGLIRYVLAGLVFVYTIGQVFGMDPKDLVPIYRLGIPPSLKLPFETAKLAVGGKSDILSTLPGYIPAGIQAKKTIQGIKAVQEGGSYDASGKFQFAQGQSTPQKIQSILFGKYAQQSAEDYFNRGEISKEEKSKVQPIYDEAQKLIANGDTAGATALVDQLSDADYETYKKIKTGVTAQKTIEGKKNILPRYNEIQKMTPDEQQAVVDAMTDDEYKYYKLVKADQEKLKKAQSGDKPSFDPNEVQTSQGVISTVWTYAKALGVDPVTAFNRIFTGQRIKYVTNGTVVVYRLPLAESQAEKKAQGSTGSEVKLDHTLPLQLGGDNSKENLKLVPTAVWATYTPIENAIGTSLRDGKINKSTAQSLIRDFKNGKISSQNVYDSLK